MNVLLIGTDKKILISGSEARERHRGYAKLLSELHIVLFTLRGYQNIHQEPNLWLYPTNSLNKLCVLWDAYRIATHVKRIDVISAQDPFFCGLVAWLAIRKSIRKKDVIAPKQMQLHIQIHTDFLSPSFWKESFGNKLRVYLARFILKRADKIRVVSDRIKQSIVAGYKLSPDNIYVLPIFVDVEAIHNAPEKENVRKEYPNAKPIFLMASRLTKEKNILLGIRAFRKVLIDNPHALLVIVGEGPELEHLRRITNQLQLSGKAIFKPWVDNLTSYYKSVDCFLLTSHYEGFGRTIIESLAAGCPVIATDVGIAREVLGEAKNGSIFPVGNEKALVLLMNEVAMRKRIYSPELPEKFILSREIYTSAWVSLLHANFKNQ